MRTRPSFSSVCQVPSGDAAGRLAVAAGAWIGADAETVATTVAVVGAGWDGAGSPAEGKAGAIAVVVVGAAALDGGEGSTLGVGSGGAGSTLARGAGSTLARVSALVCGSVLASGSA